MKTEIERVSEIMETLLAHQPIIDVPYETTNDIAIALVKEGYGDVKQAQIDVLNKAKEKLDSAPNGWAYTTYIDELIEDVENGK